MLVKRIIKKIRADLHMASLGSSILDRVKLFIYALIQSFIFHLNLPWKVSIQVTVRMFNRTATVVLHEDSDLTIFREIFVGHEYAMDVIDPKTILDIGSNCGLSVIYFKLRYPHAMVYAYEPAPIVFEHLLENIKQFGDSVQAHRLAISDKKDVATMYIDAKSMSSSLVRERGLKIASVSVETINLDGVVHSTIDILKFDIEGVEYKAFKSFKKWDKVRHIIGEIHIDLMSDVSLDTFLALFKGSYTVNVESRSQNRHVMSAQYRI